MLQSSQYRDVALNLKVNDYELYFVHEGIPYALTVTPALTHILISAQTVTLIPAKKPSTLS